jgi:hypothetical protein
LGEGVFVLIDVDQLVAAEIDRIGLKDPGAAEEIGMLELESERLPAAGGGALEVAGVRTRDDPKLPLQRWDDLGDDGIAALATFVVILALEQLGMATALLVSAFQLSFGGLCLGLALAFGFGGRRWAESVLERRFPRR